MQSQDTRLRCKRSHMPCDLLNFIFGDPGIGVLAGTAAGVEDGEDETGKKKNKVGKNPAGEEKKCVGGRRSVTTTTDSTMSSDVLLAQSLCRCGCHGEGSAQQRGSEESKRAARRRARARLGACAALLQGHLCMRRAYPHTCSSCHACCLLRQVCSCPSMGYSVRNCFLQVVVAVSFQRPARDDNGNVETKPVCSGLLQLVNAKGRHARTPGSRMEELTKGAFQLEQQASLILSDRRKG